MKEKPFEIEFYLIGGDKVTMSYPTDEERQKEFRKIRRCLNNRKAYQTYTTAYNGLINLENVTYVKMNDVAEEVEGKL